MHTPAEGEAELLTIVGQKSNLAQWCHHGHGATLEHGLAGLVRRGVDHHHGGNPVAPSNVYIRDTINLYQALMTKLVGHL